MRVAKTWVTLATTLVCTSARAQLPVQTVGGVSLPGVPPAVVADTAKTGSTARENGAGVTGGSASEQTDTNVAVTVTPGAAEIIRIASGFLNRIITPFENPKLLSVNSLEVQKEGSSLYVAASSDRPIGVHVLSNDPDDPRSISLTLIPSHIPPRTVTLKWPDGIVAGSGSAGNSRAKHWEESAPYEETLLELVRLIGRGEIPEGYSLAEHPSALPCVLPGVQFTTGQRLTGTHFSVFVLRATNTTRSPVEIYSHGGCNLPGVVLVAPWPSAYLESQASTELYVAVANETFEPHGFTRVRPSLLSH
ncbi:MAG: type-F conjugative transfer system secretin TraK [Steroidobacteraceae bacterium]